MAIIELRLDTDCPPTDVYTVLRSATGTSVAQLRQRASSHLPVHTWNTDDFPLAADRKEHHAAILAAIKRLASCECKFRLEYRPTPDDNRELVSVAMLENLFDAEIEYESQTRD